MIGPDAGCSIYIDCVRFKASQMSVHIVRVRVGSRDFIQQGIFPFLKGGIVHHFSKSEDTFMLIERFQLIGGQCRSCIFERGGRDAGREHGKHLQGDVLRIIQHKPKSFFSRYIANFMWIRDDSGNAVWKNDFGKFWRGDHGGFDMNMGIDKGRTNVFAFRIYHLSSFVMSDPYEHPIWNRHITFCDFQVEDINDLRVFYDHVCRDIFIGRCNPFFKCFFLFTHVILSLSNRKNPGMNAPGVWHREKWRDSCHSFSLVVKPFTVVW